MELQSVLERNKKGQVGNLAPAVVALGTAAIVLVLMLVILQEVRDTDLVTTGAAGCNATDTSACDVVYTASNDTLGGLGTFSDFWVIIVLAIVASVVIAIIFGVFGRTRR